MADGRFETEVRSHLLLGFAQSQKPFYLAGEPLRACMVGQPGLEPGTSVLSGLRSNRLSYWPKDEGRIATSSAPVEALAPWVAIRRRLISDSSEYIFGPKTVSR